MDMDGIRDMLRRMDAKPERRSLVVPYGGRPKYVKFVRGDTGTFLYPLFFEDPRKHNPQPGPLGQIHAWGLYPYEFEEEPENVDMTDNNTPCFDGILAMMRTMVSQDYYFIGNSITPEKQFVRYLMERKREKLKGLDLNGLDKRDVILKLTLDHCKGGGRQPRIWRRFRVSAGIKLSSLQDKAIAPIMGWVRNLHCYTFTDFRDGALFGPKKSDSVDVVHIAQVGYDYLPDDKYTLAHLFAKEGDQIGYLYDFGDKWYHSIVVEKILPAADSHGSIEIIDGNGACPGENLKGSFHYSDYLRDYYYKDGAVAKFRKRREILSCPNYTYAGKPTPSMSQFDLSVFDVSAARIRLAEALASTNSVRSGTKKFNIPLGGLGGIPNRMDHTTLGSRGAHIESEGDEDDDDEEDEEAKRNVKGKGKGKAKGPHITETLFEPGKVGHWEESHSSVKDKAREALCASCGKPGGTAVLKTCAGCRKVLYCSADHQKEHWKIMHKHTCTREFLANKA